MESIEKDAIKSRTESPFSHRHQLLRLLWGMVWVLLFRPSPRPFRAWRRGLLILFGARIDRTANIYPGVRIWAPWRVVVGADTGIADGVLLYSQDWIRIGDRVVISQESYLCAGSHDYTQDSFPLITNPIDIGNDVWIAARAFVHPGVKVANGVVVGACAVVTKDLPEWTVCAGNPCKVIKERARLFSN
jgi:putative colanic acid biosynthesis acetyltransferase WcaF